MLKIIGTQSLVLGAAVGFALGAPGHPCSGSGQPNGCASPAPAVRAAASKVTVVMLGGTKRIERSVDRERAGHAEAFPFHALRSGATTSISLYIDLANRARSVAVAIYSNAGGKPGALLTSGRTRRLRRGHWIRIAVHAKTLKKGNRYWIAVLGSGGTLVYRDRQGSGCSSAESAVRGLRRFPAHWRIGPRWATCPISSYVDGRATRAEPPKKRKRRTSSGRPTTTSPTTATRPGTTTTRTTTTTTTTTPKPTGTGCFASPQACGYPDQANTGVPAGVTLTPSGSITAGNGAVISGKDVTGSIEVVGNNVTIVNTRVTDSGDSANAIHIDGGVSGTKIQNSTLRGQSVSNGIQYAVSNSGSGTVATGVDMYNCTECWSGNGTLENSYAISNASIAGAHYEAVYVPGGTTEITDLEHNTLLNPNNQTAGIFGDDHAWGPIHNLTINNNLVADGGDNGGIVTGCNGDGNTNIVITNNRISFAYDASMPPASSNLAATTWSNNYRDDNLQQIADSSNC